MFLLNGKKFNPYAFFEHDGVQYPSNWFASASTADRLAVGIVEVPDPVRPDDRFFYIQEHEDGSFTSVPKELQPIKNQFKTDIDITCGNIRDSIVSRGLFVEEEYRVAYEEALTFKAEGYAGTVPPSVQTWVDVTQQTPQWAADDIIATRNTYVTFLNTIRDIRLKAKAAIDAASTPDQIIQEFTNFHTTVASLSA